MSMGEAHQFKTGDILEVPLAMQVLSVLGEEDRVFYLCVAANRPKRYIALKDPFFLICTEPADDAELNEIPKTVVGRAETFITRALNEVDDNEDGDEGNTNFGDHNGAE
jgi:hypothetical protein